MPVTRYGTEKMCLECLRLSLMRQPALGLRPQSKVGNRSHRGTIGHRGFNYGSM